jgi:glutathione S-transferase
VTLVLHDVEFHENSYKVRLLLGLVGLDWQRGTAGRSPDEAEADLPALADGTLVIRGAEAILAYVARRYDWRDRWLPADEPVLFGETLTWLSFASRRLRAVGVVDTLFGMAPDDPEEMQAACVAFRFLDTHLMARGIEGQPWLVGRMPTVADVAVFPAVAMSAAAGFDLDPFPSLGRWMRDMRLLPGFVEAPLPPAAGDDGRLAPPRRLPRTLRGSNVIALPATRPRPANSAA